MTRRRRLWEYDRAHALIMGAAIDGYLAADPLFGQIKRRPTQHRGPIRNVRTPAPLDQRSPMIDVGARISITDIRDLNIEAHSVFIYELAEAQRSELAKRFFKTADEISDAAGTTYDAKGEKLSWDRIIDMVEKMPISFEADGTPRLPSLFTHPDDTEKLGAVTADQQKRLDVIIDKKREEHAATKRHRRLPRPSSK